MPTDLVILIVLTIVVLIPGFIGALKTIGAWPRTCAKTEEEMKVRMRKEALENRQRLLGNRMLAEGKRIDVRKDYVVEDHSDIRRTLIRAAGKRPQGLSSNQIKTRGNPKAL